MTEKVELTTLELSSLDFVPVIPCEHGNHLEYHQPEQPAKYLIHHHCPSCHHDKVLYICQSGWDDNARGLKCMITDDIYSRDEAWTVLGTI